MGVSLCFVAPPVGSAAAAKWGLWAAYAAFLAVFLRSGARDGLRPCWRWFRWAIGALANRSVGQYDRRAGSVAGTGCRAE
jgi:hypothetical protein